MNRRVDDFQDDWLAWLLQGVASSPSPSPTSPLGALSDSNHSDEVDEQDDDHGDRRSDFKLNHQPDVTVPSPDGKEEVGATPNPFQQGTGEQLKPDHQLNNWSDVSPFQMGAEALNTLEFGLVGSLDSDDLGNRPDVLPKLGNPDVPDPSSTSTPNCDPQSSGNTTGEADLGDPITFADESLRLGEQLTVQDRFHTLLKRRLQTEIQMHPPLFPWETEISDYESDYEPENLTFPAGLRIPVPLWATQLQNFNLPAPLPEQVLARLLERCQDVVQTSLQEGAKLVRAVESLFPDQTIALNHLAGRMLMSASATRSGDRNSLTRNLASRLPDYDAALPPQQMVLAMLAAQEIFAALTLTVSPNQPSLQRQWLTSAGALNLKVEAQSTGEQISMLRISGDFPCGGSLTVQAGDVQNTAIRSKAGCLSVEVIEVTPGQTYPLTVQFPDLDQKGLTFAVHPVHYLANN